MFKHGFLTFILVGSMASQGLAAEVLVMPNPATPTEIFKIELPNLKKLKRFLPGKLHVIGGAIVLIGSIFVENRSGDEGVTRPDGTTGIADGSDGYDGDEENVNWDQAGQNPTVGRTPRAEDGLYFPGENLSSHLHETDMGWGQDLESGRDLVTGAEGDSRSKAAIGPASEVVLGPKELPTLPADVVVDKLLDGELQAGDIGWMDAPENLTDKDLENLETAIETAIDQGVFGEDQQILNEVIGLYDAVTNLRDQ